MHLRFARAAVAALLIAVCGTARAETPTPTPIYSYADATGLWLGFVDLTTKVVMTVTTEGLVTFYGPNNVTQQGVLKNERLLIQSASTDLDCGIMNEKLTCHARFGRMYAELNLTKKP